MPTQSEIRTAYLDRLDAHLATTPPDQALADLESERTRVESAMAWLSRAARFEGAGNIRLPGGLDFGSLDLIAGDLTIRINRRLDGAQAE